MKLTETIKNLSFSQIILYVSLCCVGIFHEYLSCLLSVVLLVWLFLRVRRAGHLTLSVTMTGIAVAVLLTGYAITPLWAVDGGDSVFGFYKFLPVLLYTLVLMQEPDGREKAIGGLPYVLTVVTVISVALMYIPALSSYFAVAGRLSGPLQYPNTFAALLLVAELLLLTKERWHWWDFACIAVLLFGVLYTGSRTVLIVAAAANVAALLINKNKRIRLVAAGGLGLGVVAVVLYCAITDSFDVIGRFLNITLGSSTFVGRLLYAYDALPVILRHPFGLGYMGYYYIQQSIQTGIYGIMYIHNDFLQFLMDVGWVPFLALAAAIVRSVFSKTLPLRYKLVLLTMVAHSCFDFDLQYVAMFMLFILFTDTDAFVVRQIKVGSVARIVTATALGALCLYFGVVTGLSRFGQYGMVDRLYPHSTLSQIELLKDTKDVQTADAIADDILARNEYVAVAYSAKANYAYSKGDFARFIQYKTQAMNAAPLATVECRDYMDKLQVGIRLYAQAGDTKSANVCKKEYVRTAERITTIHQRLSPLGEKINEQPSSYISAIAKEYVEQLKEEGFG